MSCKFSDFNTGKCQMYTGDFEMPGCDDNGCCICEDDEDQTFLCEYYEEC